MKNAVHQYEDKLLEFAYGELSAPEADAVDAHVRGCTRCAQSLAQLQAVRSTVKLLPVEPAPEAGLDSLLAFAEQQARRNAAANAPRPWWKPLTTPRLLATFASLAAMVTVGVLTWRGSDEAPTPTAQMAAAPEEVSNAVIRKDVDADAKEAPAGQSEGALGKQAVALAEPKPDNTSLVYPQDARKSLSSTKPSVKENKTKRADKKAELASNFSDAYRGGADQGRLQEAATEEAEATLAGRSSAQKGGPTGGFGLGTVSGEETRQKSDVAAKKPSAEPVVVASAVPPPPPPASSPPAAAAPRESKTGAGVKLPGYAQASTRDAEAEDDGVQGVDKLGAADTAATRQRVERRKAALDQARAAGQRNDRLSEVRLSLVVIEQGAVGTERGEALKRVCDGYESLGEFEQADPYCDALVREFPNTVAAQDVSRRRGYQQRAVMPAKPAPKTLADEAPKAPERLEKKAKKQAAPASSH